MMLFRSLAAAVLMLVAAPAYAQDKISVGDWDIFTNESNCSAITTAGEATVWLAYSVGDDQATLMLVDNTVFASVKDSQPFDAVLAFVQGESLDSQWSGLRVQGAELDNGSKGVMIRAPGDAFLKTVGKSDYLGLLRGSDAVISIKTGDVRPVMAALRSCAAKIK